MKPDWYVDPEIEKESPLMFDLMMAWKVRKVEELESKKCLPEQERLRGLAERLCWTLKDEWLHGELVEVASEWLAIDLGLNKPRKPRTTHRRGFPEWLERWQALPEEDKLRELVRCLYCEMPGRQNGVYDALIQTAEKELAIDRTSEAPEPNL